MSGSRPIVGYTGMIFIGAIGQWCFVAYRDMAHLVRKGRERLEDQDLGCPHVDGYCHGGRECDCGSASRCSWCEVDG